MRISDSGGQPTAPLRTDADGSPTRERIGFRSAAAGEFVGDAPPVRRPSGILADSPDGPPESKAQSRGRKVRSPHRPDEGLRRGRPRFCPHCGSVMQRSSRMVLSAAAAFLLILVGAGLMGAYGLATNFLQTPWYIKFTLPAMYYIGSLFVGVGVLFFFIREKVWRCEHCREVRKR